MKVLEEELKDINTRLRMKKGIDSTLLAIDKYFSEIRNYLKSSNNTYKMCIERYYLGHNCTNKACAKIFYNLGAPSLELEMFSSLKDILTKL